MCGCSLRASLPAVLPWPAPRPSAWGFLLARAYDARRASGLRAVCMLHPPSRIESCLCEYPPYTSEFPEGFQAESNSPAPTQAANAQTGAPNRACKNRPMRPPRRRQTIGLAHRSPKCTHGTRALVREAAARPSAPIAATIAPAFAQSLQAHAKLDRDGLKRPTPLRCTPCPTQLSLMWPCITVMKVQKLVYPPRSAVRGSVIKFPLLSKFVTGVPPGLCDHLPFRPLRYQ
jgi:hypothetical protein